MTSHADEKLMTKDEVAELLGVTIRTLAHWRYRGKLCAHTRQPPTNARTSEVLYRESDVRAYGVLTGRLQP